MKARYLAYLFATGIGDGLFFLGVGKMLSQNMKIIFGVTILFLINSFTKIFFQFLISNFETKIDAKKAILFSEVFQAFYLIGVVIFDFDLKSKGVIILSLLILNFFESLSKIAEFNISLKIFQSGERRRYNSIITTINQTSRILGFVIGGVLLSIDKYSMLFILNGISFIASASIINSLNIKNDKVEITSSWKELINIKNMDIIVYTFLIGSNTVILSANSILGFDLSGASMTKTTIYQMADAIGSSVAAIFLAKDLLKIKKCKNENALVVLGILIQGVLFYIFNYILGYGRAVVFVLISTISYFNLSIYITKLQEYADRSYKSKVYSLRQLNRAIFSLIALFILKKISLKLGIKYQNIASIFCLVIVALNLFFIKIKLLTYNQEK